MIWASNWETALVMMSVVAWGTVLTTCLVGTARQRKEHDYNLALETFHLRKKQIDLEASKLAQPQRKLELEIQRDELRAKQGRKLDLE